MGKDINCFNELDYIGVSISEDCNENSTIAEVKELFKIARQKKINTWISLEPINTYAFAEMIIKTFQDKVSFIRVGKNDLYFDEEQWKIICDKINGLDLENVFVKE